MSFKVVKADLLENVVSVYDQTKTTITGRVLDRIVDGKRALGPPLNKFLDVTTDAAITLAANNMYMTENGRIFVISSEVVVATIALYSINYDTGAYVYIGKVVIPMPDTAATTTVYRAFKIIDAGTTGWKIFLVTTGSVAINGGPLLVNNLALSDFLQVGFPTLSFGNGDDLKAVYKLEDPANTGAGNLLTAAAGAVLDRTNNKLYVHNGIAATHQYHVFNTNVAPTYVSYSITGDQSANIINHTAHPFVAGDPVVLTSATGGAGLTVGQVYFVGGVTTNSYFLSLTTGGAAINYSTDITSGTIGRAFGTTHALFSHKTGNLPPLSGTLLLTDSEDYALPGHGPNSGQPCVFFVTANFMYMGQLSELTSGATTWPSLDAKNLLGTLNQIVAPVVTNAAWSNILDRAIISTGQVFIMKQMINSQIDRIFGGSSNKYLEGFNHEAIELQPTTAVSAMDAEQGWLGITTITPGQRGIILADLRSDDLFEYSTIITKVLDTPDCNYVFLKTIETLFDYTGVLSICYRTSGFGSELGGWIKLDDASDLSGVASAPQIQFLIHFATLGLDTSIPAQVCNLFLGVDSLVDNSEHWELSVERSDNGNPSFAVWRLKKAYASAVPALRALGYSLTSTLVFDKNTSAHATSFKYSTDDGAVYNNLGTIPNVVGTLVKFTLDASPGIDVRPSLREL